MIPAFAQRILSMIFLLAVACAPLIHALYPETLGIYSNTSEALVLLPYVFLIMVAFLGLRLNQVNILILSALLGWTYFVVNHDPVRFPFDLAHPDRVRAISAALPLSLTLVIFFPLSNPYRIKTLFKLMTAFLPLVIALYLQKNGFPGNPDAQFLPKQYFFFWDLPDVSILSLLIFSFAYGIPEHSTGRTFNRTLFLCMIPIYTGLNMLAPNRELSGATIGLISASSFTYATFLLVYAMFRAYWEKAYVDELTEIPNRRALDEKMKTLDGQYAIAMIDIDHFKRFNDNFGHYEGDNVLRFVAKHLERLSRNKAYRYGGEEFALLFENSGREKAFRLTDHIRMSLAAKNFFLRQGDPTRKRTSREDRGTPPGQKRKVHITISAGIAERKKNRKSSDVLRVADKALYMAKSRGRNRTVVAP